MKLIQSPLFYATVIHLILILVAAFKMTKAPDGAAILSLVILGAGILIGLAILLLDWGIRSMPIHFYAKLGFQLFIVMVVLFFEHHLLLGFLNYKP
jgi:high-affinity Fe2+/Pb2+ permease